MGMHDDQIEVRDDVVAQLIASQFPQWREAKVRRIESSGTVNAIFRIGEDLAARFPLQPGAVDAVREILESEAEASRRFAEHSPFLAPRPVAIGDPGEGYPLPWAVQTWLPGEVASPGYDGSAKFALDLARLINELRATDTGGRRFQGRKRGGDLRSHDDWVRECLEKSADLLDVPLLRRMWSHFRVLPRTSADVMSHGDLTPHNVLVTDGRLAGVLDTGDFAPADPALDVIAGWHLLGDQSRAVFRAELRCDDVEWERSKAWAFEQCLGAIWYYIDTNPPMYHMGRATLDRIVADTGI